MADLKSERFKKDNEFLLESIREKCTLPLEMLSFLTTLLEEWKTVEAICFRTPEAEERQYVNTIVTDKPYSNQRNNIRPDVMLTQSVRNNQDENLLMNRSMQDFKARSPLLPPKGKKILQESSGTRPLPLPPLDNRSPIAIPKMGNTPLRYAPPREDPIGPTYTNTVISVREPYPNYSDRNRSHLENKELQHNLNMNRYPTETAVLQSALPNKPQLNIPHAPLEIRQHTQYHQNDIFGESNTIIHESLPKELGYPSTQRPPLPLDDGEIKTNRQRSGLYPNDDRPPFPTPYMYPQDNIIQSDNIEQCKIERSNSIDILSTDEIKPRLPPRRNSMENISSKDVRKFRPKPGDPQYANFLDTPRSGNTHRIGDINTINYDTMSNEQKKENSNQTNEPLKNSDQYLVLLSSPEEDKQTQQQEFEKREGDTSLAVFNLRELINERTELALDQQGYKKRKVLLDKTSSPEEAKFYDIISNHSVFYLYLAEHNILTQEMLSLEHPIGIVLTEKLTSYYNYSMAKSVVTLGAQVGLLEVNDRINTGPQKLENFLKKITGKGKIPLDPTVSLHQINVFTSHIICISQANAGFDENNYNRYISEREQNLPEHFHRSLLPLVQGALPLRKDNVKNLISYLGAIYRLKDWERMIPDVYKNDPEMNSHIEPSINLCMKSSPDEIMPQVIKLAEESRLRESTYFYVKINNKVDKRIKDTVLGINKRNFHLLSMSRSCEIDLATMWSTSDVDIWSMTANKEIVIKFKDECRLQLVSPEHSEDLIHKILKCGIKPKTLIDIK
ncbi:hypothetical protein LOD99_11708 [Oopsacas minuta]|uniref:Uncharacterized protein n=1 Tax=Oopsacas minuta TaxID=111878 RepID=A0AAV7JKU6_9METZ|nr:hypothetical protein LOD99_11708 [Oopsacas minuta]